MLYAISMSDGSVAIMQTAGDAKPEDCIGKWPEAEQSKVVSHRPVSADVIPTDRTFRNAWIDTGRVIAHDMGKAREIKRAQLRADRAPKLAALDVEYQRADEAGDQKAKGAVAAQKQALRDAPAAAAIDAAMTVEALKALTLDKLTEKLK